MELLEGIPDILFKYRDYSNKFNRKTLFEFEVFLSSTSMFNDPYEGTIPFTYEPSDLTDTNIFLKLREIAQKTHPEWTETQIHEYCYEGQKKELLKDEAHIERENEKNIEEIDKLFGILSLSRNPLNYLMWSHYANKHKGFCIGFDKFILFELIGGSLGPVVYSETLPKLRLFEDIVEFQSKQLGTKSKDWDYEEEYRVIKIYAARKTFNYPKEMIKEIYLGYKMEHIEKMEIIDFVKTNKIDCIVYDLSLDKEIFRLNQLRIY